LYAPENRHLTALRSHILPGLKALNPAIISVKSVNVMLELCWVGGCETVKIQGDPKRFAGPALYFTERPGMVYSVSHNPLPSAARSQPIKNYETAVDYNPPYW
tara:strand:- start:143 stop:451 length:309 start_codon:yes stop_codon:yes gene_type:complete